MITSIPSSKDEKCVGLGHLLFLSIAHTIHIRIAGQAAELQWLTCNWHRQGTPRTHAIAVESCQPVIRMMAYGMV
jgi:hypothetical protein